MDPTRGDPPKPKKRSKKKLKSTTRKRAFDVHGTREAGRYDETCVSFRPVTARRKKTRNRKAWETDEEILTD